MRVHTPRDLGVAARGRRIDLGWSQADAARAAGLSRKWVSEFEGGKSSVEVSAVMRLLDALGLVLDVDDTDRGPAAEGAVDLDEILDAYDQR